jgi:hypothetical protein
MKLVYIAGPYRGETAWEVEQNIRRAEIAAYKVAKCGALPVCPHANTRPYFQSCRDDRFWLDGYLELVRRCDAFMPIEGWRESTGSVAEREEAFKSGSRVFVEEDYALLKAWVDEESEKQPDLVHPEWAADTGAAPRVDEWARTAGPIVLAARDVRLEVERMNGGAIVRVQCGTGRKVQVVAGDGGRCPARKPSDDFGDGQGVRISRACPTEDCDRRIPVLRDEPSTVVCEGCGKYYEWDPVTGWVRPDPDKPRGRRDVIISDDLEEIGALSPERRQEVLRWWENHGRYLFEKQRGEPDPGGPVCEECGVVGDPNGRPARHSEGCSVGGNEAKPESVVHSPVRTPEVLRDLRTGEPYLADANALASEAWRRGMDASAMPDPDDHSTHMVKDAEDRIRCGNCGAAIVRAEGEDITKHGPGCPSAVHDGTPMVGADNGPEIPHHRPTENPSDSADSIGNKPDADTDPDTNDPNRCGFCGMDPVAPGATCMSCGKIAPPADIDTDGGTD